MTVYVVGLDLSLQATGIAYCNGESTTVGTDKLRGQERQQAVVTAVRFALDCYESKPDLVVVEGYSYGSRGNATVDIGELGGIVRWELRRAAVRFINCPPTTLKKYATGRGNKVGKPEMVAQARERLGFDGYDPDQADALWLRAAGLELLGRPLVRLPKVNRSALDRLADEMDVPRPSLAPEEAA